MPLGNEEVKGQVVEGKDNTWAQRMIGDAQLAFLQSVDEENFVELAPVHGPQDALSLVGASCGVEMLRGFNHPL